MQYSSNLGLGQEGGRPIPNVVESALRSGQGLRELRTQVSFSIIQTIPQDPSSAPGKLLTTLWDVGKDTLSYPDSTLPPPTPSEVLKV